MDLYDRDGFFIDRAQEWPPPVSCTLQSRGTLEVSTTRPVAYAIIFNPPFEGGYDCTDGCCDGDLVVIDNVSFDGGVVPVRPASWASLKVRYR